MSEQEIIDLVIVKAPQLRNAGVRSFEMTPGGYVKFSLAEAEPVPVVIDKRTERKAAPVDPLDDPDTFGGGGVPGFINDKPPDDEDI